MKQFSLREVESYLYLSSLHGYIRGSQKKKNFLKIENNYKIHFRKVYFFIDLGPDFKKQASTLLFLQFW